MSHELLEVMVNGQVAYVRVGTTVADVVAEHSPSDKGLAVAVDRQVVPRSAWESTRLEAGCQVEIVGAAAGG